MRPFLQDSVQVRYDPPDLPADTGFAGVHPDDLRIMHDDPGAAAQRITHLARELPESLPESTRLLLAVCALLWTRLPVTEGALRVLGHRAPLLGREGTFIYPQGFEGTSVLGEDVTYAVRVLRGLRAWPELWHAMTSLETESVRLIPSERP